MLKTSPAVLRSLLLLLSDTIKEEIIGKIKHSGAFGLLTDEVHKPVS